MGRSSQGHKLRNRDGIWTVRFRIDKKQHEYSTGVKAEPATAKRPSEAAVAEGRRIYAAALAGEPVGKKPLPPLPAASDASPLAERAVEWVDQLAIREVTRDAYEGYTVGWLKVWRSTADLSDATLAVYITKRLRSVTRKSVLNEASALRSFCTWLHVSGAVAMPLTVPGVPKALGGTKFKVRRRVKAPELSPQEVERLLAHLPIKSRWGHAVRARFILMFDTTLRPATLDKLSIPENWARGEVALRVRPEDDKEGYDREVPLTDRALAALDASAPVKGLIFGKHNYRGYLTAAAKAALPASKAAIFTGQHIRSAAVTRYLELSNNLPGVQHMAGHKHASTTARYVRASFRAASAVVASFIRGRRSREADSSSSAESLFSADLFAPTLGLEPRTRRLTVACSTN